MELEKPTTLKEKILQKVVLKYSSKHPFKKTELIFKDLIYLYLRLVLLIDKVDDKHFKLLPIAMAAAYSLFNSLGVPR